MPNFFGAGMSKKQQKFRTSNLRDEDERAYSSGLAVSVLKFEHHVKTLGCEIPSRIPNNRGLKAY